MNKEEALKLVGDLATASVRSFRAENGEIRAKHACEQEAKIARKLLQHLTSEPFTDEELNRALGG